MKFEQVAFHTPDLDVSRKLLSGMFGLTEWVEDEATGVAFVFDRLVRTPITAELAFNHESGFEFELLNYPEGQCWHYWRDPSSIKRTFLSHIAIHVPDVVEAFRSWPQPVRVAQLMATFHHTNKYLTDLRRTYVYLILDTAQQLGFDVKFIQRVQHIIPTTEEDARVRLRWLLKELQP